MNKSGKNDFVYFHSKMVPKGSGTKINEIFGSSQATCKYIGPVLEYQRNLNLASWENMPKELILASLYFNFSL